MHILNHFQNINFTNDQKNAIESLSVFLAGDEKVFILQGYAGSGKTTLLKGVIDFLMASKKPFDVMAPTGRASKILRDKTGYGQTIHRTIYNFEELKTIQDRQNDGDHSFQYVFPIRKNSTDGKIMIVDEASMISSRESQNELFTFGTNILLNDLITYSEIPSSKNKIIFVGDPSQLPPVGDNSSYALMPEYFRNIKIETTHCVLKEVVRQKDNLILNNATQMRTLLGQKVRNELSLTHDETSFIKIKSEDIPRQYSEQFPVPEIGQGVIIAFSNSQCLQYNRAVRKKIFPDNLTLTVGDLVIINQNNYHTYRVELMNGEMAMVVAVDDTLITRNNIPIYETINGKRIKKQISLAFRKATIRVAHHPEEINCFVIDSLLNSPNRDLTISEMKALYIDFVIRFQSEQKVKKESGLPHYNVGSEEFKEQLKSDSYFNALRIKYGYAITCHKSQGGEWPTTFVDYYGRTSLKDDPLRWSYTATTRAMEKCYAANAPNVTLFSSFTINEIQSLTNMPSNALVLNNIPLSPYHKANQHKAKSLKYWEISEKLEDSPFQIISVNSYGDYQERYAISLEDEQSQFNGHHNNAGIFKDFDALNQNEYLWHAELLKLLNQPHQITYNINYTASIPVLEKLHGLMQSICAELNITVTNIEEKVDNYLVQYFLKTDARCVLILFYFNGKSQLTRALPKSTAGSADEKLSKLITKLRANVI
jgi:hypothetical protein